MLGKLVDSRDSSFAESTNISRVQASNALNALKSTNLGASRSSSAPYSLESKIFQAYILCSTNSSNTTESLHSVQTVRSLNFSVDASKTANSTKTTESLNPVETLRRLNVSIDASETFDAAKASKTFDSVQTLDTLELSIDSTEALDATETAKTLDTVQTLDTLELAIDATESLDSIEALLVTVIMISMSSEVALAVRNIVALVTSTIEGLTRSESMRGRLDRTFGRGMALMITMLRRILVA